MGKRTCIWFLLFMLPLGIFAQTGAKGWVQNEKGERLENVHVINKSTLSGGLTNRKGYFGLKAEVGDTLVFSMLSYSYHYHTLTENDLKNDLKIILKKQNYMLDEVSIFSYELSTNEPRAMPLKKPYVPGPEDIREPRVPAPAGFANPVDAIYQMFDKRLKQLKILEEYKQKDEFQRKLEEGNNREILLKLTGMEEQEVRPFLFYCRMGIDYMRSATDYELLISLIRCYQQYVREREMQEYYMDYE